MKIGISSLFIAEKPFEELLAKITSYGAECRCWEIVDEYRRKIDQRQIALLKDLKESYGLEYTVHAPFSDLNIASMSSEVRRLSLKILKRSLSNAAALGARVWIFHPGNHGPMSCFLPGEDVKLNLDSTAELADYAADVGVQLGIENMPNGFAALLARVEEFEGFFQAAKPNIGLALDVGHAHTVGQLELFLKKFGDRLVHVHVHDNNRSSDAHLDIGAGSINWVETLSYLKRDGFNGILMVESIYDPLRSFRTLREFVERGVPVRE